MGDFMLEDALDRCTYLVQRAAAYLDRTLVDADLVWQDQAIVVGPLCPRDAVVEAQKLCRMAYSSLPHRLRVWPVLYHDLHVVQLRSKSLGQVVQGLGHEVFKHVSVHRKTLYHQVCSLAGGDRKGAWNMCPGPSTVTRFTGVDCYALWRCIRYGIGVIALHTARPGW